MNHDIHARLRELDVSMGDWLTPSESKSFQILASVIRRYLRQKGIGEHFEVQDVFSETYLRIRKKIEEGEEIENYRAWFRKAMYLIVCEKKRTLIKSQQLIERIENEAKISENFKATLDLPFDLSYPLLYEALKRLDEEEMEIISLRYWNELSWEDVVNSSEVESIRKSSTPALRQRKRRIIVKLKGIIEALIQEESEITI